MPARHPPTMTKSKADYRLLGACFRRGRSKVADPKEDLIKAAACSQQAGHRANTFSVHRPQCYRRGPQHTVVQRVQHGHLFQRDKDRIRYPHRARHHQCISNGSSMVVGTLNLRGWNWAAQDPRHEEKTHEVLWQMRSRKFDVFLLSDLHHAESRGWDTKDTIVAMEEFILVVGQATAICLSPAAPLAWQEAGCFHSTETPTHTEPT